MYVLGIETSCDETACAVLKNYNVLSNITISSLKEHKKYGGVVPEIATRSQLKNIDKVVRIALDQAGISLKRIGLLSVTYKPGLLGALLVGLNFAKALAIGLNKPFIGVNHLYAHLFASFLNNRNRLVFPFIGLVVSGGHTEIYLVEDFDCIKLIGGTLDDACGEVYDKVAKAFGYGYPGGPIIDNLFNYKYKDQFKFKCGKIGFDLSFSGIKTALIYKKDEFLKKGLLTKDIKIKLLSSFQKVVVETVVNTVLEAIEKFKIKRVVCGGGVIANSFLRNSLKKLENKNLKILIPPFEYCLDNASIVAGLGFYLYNKKGLVSSINLKAEPN